MFSHGHTMTGTDAQEHFRALCVYLGAPHGAIHGDLVLQEAIECIQGLPANDITLEAALTASRIEILDAMEAELGTDPYRLDNLVEHRMWLRVYHLAPGPEVRDRFAERAIAVNSDAITSENIVRLCAAAALQHIPELLVRLVDHPLMEDDILVHALGDSRIIESDAFRALSQALPPRLVPSRFTKEDRAFLTFRHHDDSTPKAIALLARTGLLLPDGRTTMRTGRNDIALEILERHGSAHGQMFLLRDLPDPETIIATRAFDLHGVLKPLFEAA